LHGLDLEEILAVDGMLMPKCDWANFSKQNAQKRTTGVKLRSITNKHF